MSYAYHVYLQCEENSLFTAVCLPDKDGKFPIIITRTPYANESEFKTEDEICANLLRTHKQYLDAGYAVVHQHCRGTGKSSGDCIPYIHEREDGLHLQDWVRKQDFYDGNLYLLGGSYEATVHYVTAPFADDIKGAVLEVQDIIRYNCNYRNGFYKSGLHGDWYVTEMYKKKSIREKPYTPESFLMLPMKDFSHAMFGEHAEDFDEILQHPHKDDPFWHTRFGGGETRDALKGINIPILLITGFYDIYLGGIFDMWNGLDKDVKKRCALVVHPYGHGGTPNGEPLSFSNGMVKELCGGFRLKWLDSIQKGTEVPFSTGKVTYYRLFENRWCCEDFAQPNTYADFALGQGEETYLYDPQNPASFKGGLCTNFGGCEYQDPAGSRQDILTFYTPEFTENRFIKGKMQAQLKVKSSAEDTCFYMRISLAASDGDYGLRDDIQSIANFSGDYTPGDAVTIDFTFDEHAFMVKKGEKLRIDISSSAFPHYVPHTNKKGLFAEQTETEIAENTIILDGSYLRIYFEQK